MGNEASWIRRCSCFIINADQEEWNMLMRQWDSLHVLGLFIQRWVIELFMVNLLIQKEAMEKTMQMTWKWSTSLILWQQGCSWRLEGKQNFNSCTKKFTGCIWGEDRILQPVWQAVQHNTRTVQAHTCLHHWWCEGHAGCHTQRWAIQAPAWSNVKLFPRY